MNLQDQGRIINSGYWVKDADLDKIFFFLPTWVWSCNIFCETRDFWQILEYNAILQNPYIHLDLSNLKNGMPYLQNRSYWKQMQQLMSVQWNIASIIWQGEKSLMAWILPEFQSLARKGWNCLKIQNINGFIEQWFTKVFYEAINLCWPIETRKIMKSLDTENSMAEIISFRTHRKLEIGAKNQTITLLAENIFIKSLQIIGKKFQKEDTK